MLTSEHTGKRVSKALKHSFETQSVIGFPIAAESFAVQIDTIINWARQRLSRVVCVANVHMLIEGKSKPEFARVLHKADLITPDGMPLVWLTQWLTKRHQDRVAGMDIMLSLCQQSEEKRISVFFLGSTTEILKKMRDRLENEFPNLEIAGMEALPFDPLLHRRIDKPLVDRVNKSQASVVFLSLGCPKQEGWMHTHKGQIKAVMIGVGGVFPIYAGEKRWAPKWVRNVGLEWAYRLLQEPRRLWKRYAKTIPPFILLVFKQMLKYQMGLNPDLSLRKQWQKSISEL